MQAPFKKRIFLGKKDLSWQTGQRGEWNTFTIRSLKIGNIVLQNVKGVVAPSQAPLLLGQSFLKRFKSWSIDNSKHELLLEELASD